MLSSTTLVRIQLLLSAMMLLGIALVPPASGSMLLLPILPGSAAHIATAAVRDGARLAGAGPLAGSVVVVGERASLLGPVSGAGGIILAAPRALCDGPER